MNNETPPKGLNAILYFLNYITDVSEEPVLPSRLVLQIKEKYKPEMVKMLCDAVKWSLNHPNFDYESQLPLNYRNDSIYEYLKKVDAIFEKENIYNLVENLE